MQVLFIIFLFEELWAMGMLNTAKAGSVNVDVGDEVIEASQDYD